MASKRLFTTRKVRYSDFEKVFSLEKKIFGESDRFSKRQIQYLLSSKNACFRLCYAGKHCVGYGINLISRLRNGKLKGRVYSIGILPTYRGQGAGSILLRAMERDLAQSSVSFITLETKKGGKGAATFFRQHGYRVVEDLPMYYASGAGLRMCKNLRRLKKKD